MNTALIQVNPSGDERVAALFSEVALLAERAESWLILSDNDVKAATEDLTIIASLKKALEEKRKEYTSPINEHLKSINDAFKRFTEPLNIADTTTRQKILAYRKAQEEIRQEQERINRLREEAAQREMRLSGELTEPVNLVEVQPVAPAHYRTGAGTLGKIMVRKWELIDQRLLPEEYKLPDSARITRVVKAGIPAIPGIRIYDEESLRVTQSR